MKIHRSLKPGQTIWIQLVLILMWVTNLRQTDSYFYVYMMISCAGMICTWENGKVLEQPDRKQRVACGVLAALFSLSVVLANYAIFEPETALMNLFGIVSSLAGGWMIGMNVLLCLLRILPVHSISGERKKPGTVFIISFAVIVCIDLVFLFLVEYPAVVTADSMAQLGEILSGKYGNKNPYWHTRTMEFFVKLGLTIFGNLSAGIALFTVVQILFLAGCYSYVVMTLYQKGIPGWAVALVWAVYALLPCHIAYSATIWKDILFSGASLLLITSFYRLLYPVQEKTRRDLLLFGLAGLGLCLWRTNGLLVYVMFFLIMLLSCRKNKKLTALMAVILVCALVLCGPVLSMQNIEGSDYVELLSIPLQQVARVVREGVPLAPEDLALIQTVAEPEVIAQTYQNEISDPIKKLVRECAAYETISQEAGTYLNLWVRLGIQNPGLYLKAWIDQTKGYWNGGYSYWIIARGIFENDLGLVTRQENIVGKLFHMLNRYMELMPLVHPLLSIGLHTWILTVCGFISYRRRNRKWLLVVPSLAIVLGLMVGTPVYSEFRYGYPVILAVPLVLMLTIFDTDPQKA